MSANSTSSSTTFGKFLFGMFSILMLLSGSLKVNAQAALYTASTGSNASLVLDKNGNAIDMSAGTTQLHGANASAAASTARNIGFTFYLLGGGTTPYSQFSANVNGAIRLGSTVVGTGVISAGASSPYLIANNIAGKTDPTTGLVHFKLHGTAPNRVLVVEWKDVWIANVGASNSNLSTYQTRIYEDGTVEYVYGTMYNNHNLTDQTSTIAIASSNAAGTIGQYTTITNLPSYTNNGTAFTNTTFPFNAAMANLNSSANGSRRYYRFAPAACGAAPTAQPTALVASATSNTFNSIGGSFTAASPAPGGYLVVRTTSNTQPELTSGVNYMFDSSYSANVDFKVVANGTSTSFTATGLGSGRTYYFWVYSYNAPTAAAPCGAQVYYTTSPLTGQATTNVQVLPSCVTSVTPTNNYNGFSPVDTLRWSAVTSLPAVTKYFVYLSKTQALVDANDASVRVDAGNVLKRQPGTLDYSSTYYWKVRAFNGTDTANLCDTKSFTTAAPSVPLCYAGAITPTSGATGVNPANAISWGTAIGAPSPTGYDIYMSTSYAAVQGLQLSAKIISNTTSITFTPGITTIVLSPNTTYYWVVIPTNYIGGASGCTVASFTTITPGKTTSTTRGGLWSEASTWASGIVPPVGDTVVIADGATVYAASAPNSMRALIIGQASSGNAILRTAATIDVTGSITIASNGKFLPINTAGTTGYTINVGGNFTNNGYANLAVASCILNFNGSQVSGGSSAQVLGGSGVFEGDTTGSGNNSMRGIIRDLRFQTTGSSSISSSISQPLVAYNLTHTGGSLNTNGKLTIDNGPQVYGRAINRKVSGVTITTSGVGYNTTNQPVIAPSNTTVWAAAVTFSLGQLKVFGSNVYVVTGAGTSGSAGPTGVGTTEITDGTAKLIWVGNTGTLGTPFLTTTAPAAGGQYFYGGKLFTNIKGTTALSNANIVTLAPLLSAATVGSVIGIAGDTVICVGTPAKATINLDNTNGALKSLNLTDSGSAYLATAPTFAIVNTHTAAPTTAAAGAATLIQQITGPANSAVTKVPAATITGGLNIVSQLRVGSISTTNGGTNYKGTPRVGFPLPTNFYNLVTYAGSGFTTQPTGVRVIGGTKLANFTNPSFSYVVAQGKVVSVICTGGGTGWLTQPDSIKIGAVSITDSAVAKFPLKSLARATAVVSAGSIVNFNVVDSGYGYMSAPTASLDSTGNTGADLTRFIAATAPATRVQLYNLAYSIAAPTSVSVEGTTGIEIPPSKSIARLTINAGVKLKLVDDLELTQSGTALVFPTSGNLGGYIDLNRKTLNCSNPLFGGFGTTGALTQLGYGYVKNGSMSLAVPGSSGGAGVTRTFPFNAPFALNTGGWTSGTTNTGAAMTKITVSDYFNPAASNPSSITPVGKKAYFVKIDSLPGSNVSPVYGANPTVTLSWNATDSFPQTLQQQYLFIGQSDSLNGTWTKRSATSGGTALIPVGTSSNVNFRTTATSGNGPFVTATSGLFASKNYFAFVDSFPTPTITSTTPAGSFCSVGGQSVTITGTNFSGVTAVLFNGVSAASFTVNSATEIVAVTPTGISAGYINVIANGITGTSASTYSVSNVGTYSATVTPANGLLCTNRDRVYISVSDINADSYSWSPSTGLDNTTTRDVIVDGSVLTSSIEYTFTAVYSSGCTITKKFPVGVIQNAELVPTASPAASCFNSGATVTLNSNLSAGNFSVSPITYQTLTPPGNAITVVSNSTTNPNYVLGGSLDDGGFPDIPIGFNFNFFGQTFNKLAVGTNGLLMFGTVPGYSATAGYLGQYSFTVTNGVIFPNPLNPGNVIGLMLVDGDFGLSTGSIKCWTEGVAPTRRFIIKYNMPNYNSASTNFHNMSAILYETTGIVEIHIQSSAYDGSRVRTIGLQNFDGTIGAVVPGRQAFTSVITTPEAWRFSPPTNYGFLWSPPTNLDATNTGAVIYSVTSPGVKSVNLKVTNPVTGCVANKVVPFTVNVTPNAPVISGVTSVCGSGFTALTSNYPAAGNSIKWYDAPIGGTLLNTGTLFVTPVIFQTTTYYVEEVTNRVLNPCSSPRTAVTVTITPPPAFAVNKPVLCGTVTSTQLNVTTDQSLYDTYTWAPVSGLYEDAGLSIPYSGRSIGTVYAGGLIPGYKKYICSASNFESLCATKDSSEINLQPTAATISASPAVICVSGTSDLTLNTATTPYPGTIQWQVSTTTDTPSAFSDIVDGTTATITAPNSLVTRYYRALIKGIDGSTCYTSPTYTLETINPQVSSASAVGFCSTSGTPVMTASAPNGGTINWYSGANQTGGTSLGTGTTYSPSTPISTTTNYYVGLTVNGCEGGRTLVTAVVSTPTPITVSNSRTVCNDAVAALSVTSAEANYNSYSWTPTANLYSDPAGTIPYVPGSSAVTVYARTTTAGTTTYTVVASNASTQCTTSGTIEVTVLAASYSVSANRTAICGSSSNNTATLTISPSTGMGSGSFAWQNSSDGTTYNAIGGATSSTYTTPVVTATTYYNALVKDQSGTTCFTAPITISYSNPSVSADSVTGGERCGSGPVALSVNNTVGTIKWYRNASGGSSVATGNNYTPTVLTSGNYYVTITINGCEGSTRTSVPVTINASPALTLASTSQTVSCNNPIVEMSVTSTLSDYDTYVWTPATNLYTDASATNAYIPGSSATTLYVKSDTAGVYIYTVSANNSLFCSNIKYDTVTVTATNPVDATPASATVCNNGITQLNATAVSSYDTYVWSPATNLYTDAAATQAYTAGENAATVYFKSGTVGTATYVAYGSNSGSPCVGTDTVRLTVMPASGTVTSSGAASFCRTGGATLTFTPASTLPAGASIQWQSSTDGTTYNDIPSATATTLTISAITSTTYYRANVKNGAGDVCFSANYTQTVVNPTITASAGGSRCGNGGVVLTATASAGASLAWYTTTNSSSVLSTSSSYTTPSVSVTTTYYVAAVIGTCESTPRTAVLATVASAPTATVTAAQTVCNNTAAMVEVTSTLSDYDSYVWTTTPSSDLSKLYTDAAGTVPYVGSTSASTVYLKTTTAGSTTVKLNATNSQTACSYTTASTIVSVQPASATAAITSGAAICKSGTATLTVTPSTGYGPGVTQTWQSSLNGTDYTNVPSATATSYTTGTLTASTYYRYTVINSLGGTCFTTNANQAVVTDPQPTSTTPASRCGFGTVTLEATAAAGTISWYASQGASSNEGLGTSFTTPTLSSTYTYWVGVKVGTCEGTRVQVVATVNPAPEVHVRVVGGVDSFKTVCNNVATQIDVMPAYISNFDTYVWTPSTNLYTDAAATIPYVDGANATTVYVKRTAIGATRYFCTATNASGCANQDTAFISVQPGSATISGSPASICTSVSPSSSLSLVPGSGYAPNTIQWQSSADGVAAYTNIGSATSTTYTATNTSTKYYQTVIKDGAGATCFTTDPYQLVYKNPSVTLPYTKRSRCGRGTVELKAFASAGATISWYTTEFGGSPLTAATDSTFITPAISAQTVYYVSATLNGCESLRVADTATVSDPPALTITAPQTVCNNVITSFSVESIVSDYESYTWSPVTNLFTDPQATVPYVSGNNASVVYARTASPGTTNYEISSNSIALGCSNLTTTSLSVQLLSATISGTPSALCINGTSTLSLSPSSPYGVGSIQWERSTDGTTFAPTPGAVGTTYVTPNQTATRYYRASVKNGAGANCFVTPVFNLVVNNPAILTTAGATICGPKTATITATTTSGSQLKWYGSGRLDDVAVLATGPSYTTPVLTSTTTFYVQASTITDATCASPRIPVTVTYNTPPAFGLSATSAAYCAGGSSSAVTITTGSASYDTYVWTPSTGITGDAQTGWVFNPQSTSTYSLAASQSTGNACTYNVPFSVTVSPLPVIDSLRANGGTAGTICNGTSATLNAYAGGIGSGPQTLPTGYLASSATSTSDDEIFNVSIVGTTLNNTSTCATIAPGPGSSAALYSNYTTSVAAPTLYAGSPYTGSITIGQCLTTAYTTGYAVFIDYNRDGDFADAGETAFTAAASTSNAVTGTVRPFNFTVPSSASPGVTMMRVVAVESSTGPAATGTYTWGETEDYKVNILALTVVNPDIVFTWTPGSLTGSTVSVSPSTTTTYTVSAVNGITGCAALATSDVTVNVNQLPTAPETSNSVQCGIAVPSCFVGGASNGDYRWYLTETGGTALAGQVNNQLSGYPISTTTTFYVAIFNGSCESLRTPVTASVIQPDQLTAASNLSASCANGQITLSVTQNGTSNTYDYVWTASPASASGIPTSVSGSSVDVTPSVAGTYVYTVTGTDATAACVAANTVTVTVQPNPVIGEATATPAAFCAGGSTSLIIAPGVDGGPSTQPSGYCSVANLGVSSVSYFNLFSTTGAVQNISNSASGYSTGGYGNFNSINGIVNAGSTFNFNTTLVGTTVGVAIWIDWDRSGTFETSERVYVTSGYVSTASGTISVPANATPGKTRMRVMMDYNTSVPANPCSINASGRGEVEDYSLSVVGNSFLGSNFGFAWTPGSLTGQTVTVSPSVNTSYVVTVTNPTTGCYSKDTVDVTVYQLPPAPTGSTSEQCGVGVPAATVTSNSAAATPRFVWYLTSTGGTALQDSTANTYTHTIDSTKVFYVAEVSAEGCEGPRAEVTANVAQPDQIQLTHSAASICLGESVDISSSYSPVNNLYDTYSIAGFPAIGSGLESSTSLTDLGFATAPITITPTEAGTYVYLITAVDNSFGCSTVGKDTIIVNALPVIDSVKASASAICAGGSVNLNAYSHLTATLPAPTTLPTGYCAGGGGTNLADEQIFAVSFASMTNAQTENCSSNYTDYSNTIPAPSLTRGSTYPLSVTVNECDGATFFSSGISVFIDYNRNGVFEDPAERVYVTTATTTNPHTKTSTVTIPANASPGRTKMRVVAMESTIAPTACGTYTYGETEDYSVYIAGDVAQTVLVNPNLTYTWNPGSVTGASATVTPAGPTASYAVTINDPATGCTSVSSPVSITVNPLPSAPIGTNSIQCGAGVPTVSVASGDATASPNLTWYNSATAPTETTQYSNLFSTSDLAGASIFGSASITGNKLNLTPNTVTQTGALTVPASGVNANQFNVAFKMTTGGGGGADGLSYSFGDDADAASTTLNAEYGTGSKLKIGFDDYGTGAVAASGIRLIYGASINDPGQVAGTNGVLAYSSNVSWLGQTDVPVVATINAAGKLTMTLNGTAVFSDVQLPSEFVNANKSTWKHVFKARTGGLSMVHAVDSVVLKYTASTIVNTGTTYSQPISQTTTFYVAETSAAGCEGPRTEVVATVNIPDSISASAASNSICLGSSVALTATTTTGSNNNNYTFTWGSTSGSGITGTTSGGTGSFGTPATTTVTPTAAGTYVFTLNGSDASGAQTCNISSSVTVVVNSLPVLDSAKASVTTVCAGAPVTLQAYSGFMDAGPATQPTGYCSVTGLGTSATSYFNSFSTTGATQNITNASSGYSASGYGDFSSQMAIASAGQTVNFNTALVGTTVGVAIWVDWNRNGTFETTERVYVTSGYVSTASGSFVVPADATPGATKMRIMMDYYTSIPANACAVSTLGQAEVEDYTFRVINGNNIDNSLNYTWNPGNVTNNTGALTVNPTTTTTYTVSATNAAGCAAAVNKSVTVTVVPVSATSSVSEDTVCNGTAVTLTATPSGTGPFTYSWSNGTSVVGTTATLSVTPSATTTYTVTVRDACNNPATSSTTVTVNPLPTASISQASPIVICAPNTQELTAVTNAASPVFTWSLNGNVIGGATTSSYTATASGSYTVAITDAATGCNSAVSSAVVITVNAQPTPIVITPSAPSICIGSSTTLSLTGGNIINPGTLALTENFNTSAPNWTITNGQSSPVASNWTLRTAPLTYASPNGEGSFNNFSTPNGGKFILAVADAGGNGSVTNTVITSPVFNTTNFTLANLVFEHAYKFSAANEAKVEVSTNGGTSWTTLKTYTGSQGTTGNNAQVTKNDTISMASYLNETNLRIRFNYQSNYGFWWLLDNIRVTGTQAVPCTYSWTPSESLNTASGATVIASPTVQTTYTVTATSQYSCTRTQSVTVSMITRPTGAISGVATICNGASANVSVSVTGSGPWSGTLSDGTPFSGSTSPISVSVSPSSTTTYTIASLSDASCASIAADLSGSATVTVNARPTAAISGTQVICEGTSANLSIAVTGAGPWSGTLSNGASFSGSSSPITVSVTPTANTTYTVATLSDANCTAIAADLTGSAAVTWKYATTSTTVISNCDSYTWNGNTYTSSGSYTYNTTNAVGCDSTAVLSLTIRVKTTSSTPAFICATQAPYSWNGGSYSTSGTYSYTTTNAVGCDSVATLVLTVASTIPNPVASVTQPSCATATGTITVTSPTGAGFQYSIGGAYQSSATFSGVAAGTYTLSVQAGSGCTSAENTSVTVNAQPIVPGATTVTGQVNVCNVIGTNTAITYTATAQGATSYTWSLPANTTLVSGQGTSTISVRFLSGFASQAYKQIRVVANSTCGSNALKVYYLAAQLPVTPSTIVASTSNVCPSIGTNVPITYTIPKVSGAASYIWTSQANTTFTSHPYSGENDTVMVVTFGSDFTSSSISVQAVNSCGTSGTRSIFVNRNNPSTPSLISGPTNACNYIGTTGVNATYSVVAVSNVDSYTWTLPAGVTNVAGQGTNTISFRYPLGFTNGTVSVTSTNGCGTSGSRSLNITRLTPSTPGNIDVINTSSCPERVYTYSVSSLPGNAASLEWSVPNGGTIVSGQGTISITVSYTSGVIDGSVMVRSINNCGVSSYKYTIVKLAPCPSGPTAPITKGLPIVANDPMEVKVFPNPTTSNFNLQVITADQQEVVVRILDVQGRFIKSVKVAPYQTVNLGAELKSGSYMLEVKQGNNLKTTRVVKY